MANFYSPDGNFEVWETKPEGYFTEEEWNALHPYEDPRTFEEIVLDKKMELKAMRDTREVEPITVNGYTFDYDDKARERINAAIIALELSNDSITWTLADNTNTSVTADILKNVIAAVAVRSNSLHVIYRNLVEQLESCTTAEEVNAITWPEDED